MDKNASVLRVWIITISVLFLLTGCQREKTSESDSNTPSQKVEHFSWKQFSPQLQVELSGESAELTPDQKVATLSQPALSLKTQDSVIEIRTGKEGSAEIKINPGLQQMEAAVLQGNIHIVQKDISGKKVLLEATCQKLTYQDGTKLLIMEGNPVVTREKNTFSGERIFYYWTENRIEIKGNVKVLVYPEKNQTP